MNSTVSPNHERYSLLTATFLEHPYFFTLFSFAICCIFTRVITGYNVDYHGQGKSQGAPRRVPIVPYWVPWIGHSVSFGIGFFDYMKNVAYKVPSGIYALRIAGTTHNIVVAPSLTRELLNKANLPMDIDIIVFRLMKLTFGDHGIYGKWYETNAEDFRKLGNVLHNLMKDPFLTKATAGVVNAAETQTYNMISGNPSWVDHSLAERAARTEIVSTDPRTGAFVAEVDFYALIRYYVGDIATSLLMGRSFLDNNPNFLDDLWLFDTKFMSLMLGVPFWLIPGAPPAIGARERMIKAVEVHHKAMLDTIDGKDPSHQYNDLGDVSSIVWDRVNEFHRCKLPARAYGSGDLVVVWALNVNAIPVMFWMLFYIYSDSSLLARIRTEIAPYAQLQQPASTGLPIKEAPRLNLDINSLLTKCPLFKGSFFETMRREMASISIRIATDDFVISESKEDAALYGKTQPDKYLIKKGDIVNIPHTVHQDNPLQYPDPQKFDPTRFWVKNKDERGNESVSIEYGTMRPWGGGKTMCKGRAFAEREVLSIVAAILVVWDVEPVGKEGWKHPGDMVTAGTFAPKKDIRVRMRRREM